MTDFGTLIRLKQSLQAGLREIVTFARAGCLGKRNRKERAAYRVPETWLLGIGSAMQADGVGALSLREKPHPSVSHCILVWLFSNILVRCQRPLKKEGRKPMTSSLPSAAQDITVTEENPKSRTGLLDLHRRQLLPR